MRARRPVLDASVAGQPDQEILARFSGAFLLPIDQLAQQLRQAQAATAGGAPISHPVYGNVSTDQVVKYEMARYGIV